MYKVVKRNGSIVDYDVTKIVEAIKKAFDATGKNYVDSTIDFIALKIGANASEKVKNNLVTVEQIQDSAEYVLCHSGYEDVAKKYILYRKEHENNRLMNAAIINYGDVVDNYLNLSDWRVKENSTVNYSLGGLILGNSGAMTADYWLKKVLNKEAADAHKDGDIHIHDLSMLSPYCAGWSLQQLITEGFGGITGKITSAPAKHLSTLCNQMVNFLGCLQNEWAGAQAFSSVDTLCAPFIKKDNLTYIQVKQSMQNLIFALNVPCRWGSQAPFVNFTFDWTVPADLGEQNCIVGGKEMDFKYKDCQAEMDMFNKAFLETMIEGDSEGRGFQYPIPTYSLTKDFDWAETENNKLLFEMTAKYGTPYFSNYINSDMNPSDVRSMCCRLRLELNELRRKNGGYFGSGDKTGSVCVVTINMPRIAYLSKDKNEFYERLNHFMDISAQAIEERRKFCSEMLERGLYPYTKRYLGSFDNHFSTIGLLGMNETCLNANWIKEDLTKSVAQDFTKEVLNYMRNRLVMYQNQYGHLFNLEATPAESTSYRLAKHDKEKYPDIITANDGTPYYTNSSHLPVNATDDIFEALDIQDELQTLYTSGTVFHGFLGEKLPNWKSAMDLVRKIASNYRLPYFTLSPTYSVCCDHGYIDGEEYTCPTCGKNTEVYSRITGYYRPVQNWNNGKSQEFKDRKEYVLKTSILHDKHIADECSSCAISFEKQSDGIGVDLPLGYSIITTPTCPKCKIIKAKLKDMGIEYNEINAYENEDLVAKLRVRSAPTMIKKSLDNFEIFEGIEKILPLFK